MTAAAGALAAVGALCVATGAPSAARPTDAGAGTGAHARATSLDAAPRAKHCPLDAKLVPSCGVLFGAYVHPVGDQSQEQAYRWLQRATGSHMRVLHFYHQGTELFPTPWEIHLANQHRRLLLNWKPEDGHTWAEVAAGEADGYIDREAKYLLHHYTRKFYLVIHHEPENDVIESPGSGFTAADFASMFRHVEDRLKSDGVQNAVFVLNFMGAQTYFVR
jgi:hypothetical protein